MASSLNRSVVLVYGIVSYFIGVAGLACIILALATLVEFGFLHSRETSNPILWNLVLVVLWGLSHSVMARRGFKNWITKFIPEPAERSNLCTRFRCGQHPVDWSLANSPGRHLVD